MRRASAIVTNRGGRTCHAAIIARELGIPAVVGCGNATELLAENQEVTVSCAEGDTGHVYEGKLDFNMEEVKQGALPEIPVKIMMNVGIRSSLSSSRRSRRRVLVLPVSSSSSITHRCASEGLLRVPDVPASYRDAVERLSAGYANPREFYISKIAEGVATIAAAFYPRKVIVRMSDFKSNEYRKLIGGKLFEPVEENPMLGFRGASRYISNSFAECFELECLAMKRVRDEMGLTNVELMIPFCRTIDEAKKTVAIMASHGLKQGENG